MPTFSVHVPLWIQYESHYDSPWFSSDYGVKVRSQSFRLGAHSLWLEYENDALVLKVLGVTAPDKGSAATTAAKSFEVVTVALSLDLQGDNPNSHYGHPRFAWRRRDVTVHETPTPPGIHIGEALGIKAIQNFNAARTQTFIDAQTGDPVLRFLMASYFDALGPKDFRSKFYCAFIIIEFIEATLSGRVKTSPLLDAVTLESLFSQSRGWLRSHGIGNDDVDRIVNRSLGNLRTATIENRGVKLAAILSKVLSISSITYASRPVAISEELASRFIKQRNRIVHAGEPSSDIKEVTDKLILVTEKVLLQLVGNPSLLIPAPSHEEIAVAAYFRWQVRGAAGSGDGAVQDWLQAEQDLVLATGTPPSLPLKPTG